MQMTATAAAKTAIIATYDEQRLQNAWREYKTTEKHGLVFGQVCFELRAGAKAVQGGTTFSALLEKLNIPRRTAYFWIERHEEQFGDRHRCDFCAETFPSKGKKKKHTGKAHSDRLPHFQKKPVEPVEPVAVAVAKAPFESPKEGDAVGDGSDYVWKTVFGDMCAVPRRDKGFWPDLNKKLFALQPQDEYDGVDHAIIEMLEQAKVEDQLDSDSVYCLQAIGRLRAIAKSFSAYADALETKATTPHHQ